MMEKIRSALRELGVDTYTVHETATRSVEAFYVRKRLDLKRRTDLTEYEVTVFRPLEREGRELLGSADAPVYPGMEDGELREALSAAYHAASYAGNPFYELYRGGKEALVPSRSGFAGRPLEESLLSMAEALFAADVHEDVFLNSAEIFAIRRVRRVVNSSGVDVSWETFEVKGEYVCQCVTPADVETYHSFDFLEPEAEELTADAAAALAQTRDRAAATQAPPAGTYTVILSGDHVGTVLDYYRSRSSAGMVYQRYSGWQVGEDVQGKDVRGSRVTAVLKAAEPYDGEGIPLRDRPLLEDGVLRTIHGGSRFAQYLGIEPTGSYRCLQVPTGSTPLAELKRRPYLHVVGFSDFQMDDLSGHFGGEIRLAYLYDGETVTPVTGGSVNGSILDAQKHMVFSAERYRSARYEGPFAVAIEDVAVAGK